MNHLDVDPEDLTRLLHERVSGLEPDLAERATTGVRTGHRIRRRRQVGAAAGSVLGVAAIVGLGLALSPGSDASDAGPGFAADPTSVPPTTPVASPSSSPTQPPGEILPVSLAAPGWECSPPADEKFLCMKNGVTVQVTVRPANAHDDYLSDPDKASPGQFVSGVHHGVFATITRTPGDNATDVTALGAALVWTAQ